MAIMIPGSLELLDPDTSYGEKALYKLFQELPDTYYVFHSLSWNERSWLAKRGRHGRIIEGEADFVIFQPEYGLLFLEVKDGLISYSREQGWVQINRAIGTVKPIDPLDQARKGMHFFLELAKEACGGRKVYSAGSAVWFTSVNRNSVHGDLPPKYLDELMLWSTDMNNPNTVRQAIVRAFEANGIYKHTPDEDTIQPVVDALAPEFKAFPDMQSRTRASKIMFLQMTREQSYLLDYLEEQEEAAIHGVAGTGKTVLAVQKAQRLAEKEPVLFLCFNRFLKDHLKQAYDNPNIEFTNLDSLYVSKMHRNLPQNPKEHNEVLLDFLMNWESYPFPYKHIIVDEGQDFFSDHLEQLHDIARTQKGCFYVFYDRNQFVQGLKFPEWLNDMECRLVLTRNCRNTREIALTSTRPIGIDEDRIKMRRETPGDVDLLPPRPNLFFVKDKAQLKDHLRQLIIKYAKAGVKKCDMVVLSCKSEGESALSKNDFQLDPTYCLTSTRNDVDILFTTVRKFKGLEADVVLCIDIDEQTFATVKERNAFYVGTSRATTYLDLLTTASAGDLCRTLTEKEMRGPRANREVAAALRVKIGSPDDLVAE